MPDVDYCKIECWPKVEVRKMSEQMSVVHDYVIIRQDREKQSEERWKRISERAKLATAIITSVVGVITVYVLLS